MPCGLCASTSLEYPRYPFQLPRTVEMASRLWGRQTTTAVARRQSARSFGRAVHSIGESWRSLEEPFAGVHFWQAFIAASVGLALFVLARGFLTHQRALTRVRPHPFAASCRLAVNSWF